MLSIERPRLGDVLIAAYVRDLERRDLRPRSIEKNRDTLRHLVRFHGRPLVDLEKDDIVAWLDAVPRVARTRYSLISCASGFYEWAIDEEFTDVNPTRKIKRPKLRRQLPRPIATEVLGFAIQQAPPMIRAWLLLASMGGLRCQEIAGLCREHVWDHEDPQMLLVAEAKGGNERAVPLHPDVLDALRLHGLPRTGLLFRGRGGKPYKPARVSQVGNAYLHGLGIAETMHQLRHRFATDVFSLSRDIRLTQEVLGHQSLATTAIYTQMNPARAVEAVRGLSMARANGRL